MPKEEVEKFKLTPEQIAWQKQFKEAKRVASMAGMGMFGIRDVLRQALFRLTTLMENKPKRGIKELAQQPKENE